MFFKWSSNGLQMVFINGLHKWSSNGLQMVFKWSLTAEPCRNLAGTFGSSNAFWNFSGTLPEHYRNLTGTFLESSGTLPELSGIFRNLTGTFRNLPEPFRNLPEPFRNLPEPFRNLPEPSGTSPEPSGTFRNFSLRNSGPQAPGYILH